MSEAIITHIQVILAFLCVMWKKQSKTKHAAEQDKQTESSEHHSNGLLQITTIETFFFPTLRHIYKQKILFCF